MRSVRIYMDWKEEYPLLYQLFEESNVDHADNYFSLMNNEKTRQYGAVTYDKWEGYLSQLDVIAFESIVRKAKEAVTIRQGDRGWEQLFNTLNEVKGYLYLKKNGYTSIEFIEESTKSRPDLYAKSDIKSVLLEVKTIRKSDDDIPRDRVWSSIDYIPEGLRNKIESDIDKSIVQLNGFYKEVDEKVCYLIIYLDLALDMNEINRERLGDYIKTIDRPGVSIKYDIPPTGS